jgi:hypothetical protein
MQMVALSMASNISAQLSFLDSLVGSSKLWLDELSMQVVALSMAITPYLAAFGARAGAALERRDVKAMQPQEEETKVGGRGRDCFKAVLARCGWDSGVKDTALGKILERKDMKAMQPQEEETKVGGRGCGNDFV